MANFIGYYTAKVISQAVLKKAGDLLSQTPIPDMVDRIRKSMQYRLGFKYNRIARLREYVTFMAMCRRAEFIAADYRLDSRHIAALQNLARIIKNRFAHLLTQPEYAARFAETELKMKPRIFFYKYYFSGKEKPVVIEARNAAAADRKIEDLYDFLLDKGYDCKNIINTTVEEPLEGISTKTLEDGQTYVWVGPETRDGWIPVRNK